MRILHLVMCVQLDSDDRVTADVLRREVCYYLSHYLSSHNIILVRSATCDTMIVLHILFCLKNNHVVDSYLRSRLNMMERMISN